MATTLRNIVIVGGGLVGQTLADRLSRDNYDVTVIETDAEKVANLADTLDVQVVVGNGATTPVLRSAGAANAGLVVASTDSDESNMVVGFLAAEIFRVPRIVVRVRDPGHEEGFALIGADHPTEHVTVNPDLASVDRIASLLEVSGALDVVDFFDGELLVAGFRIGPSSDFAGLHVSDLNLLFAATPTLAVAIHRGADWLIPHGSEAIEVDDLVYFAIAREELSDVLSLVGVEHRRTRRVMIAGAGPIGLGLARRLRSSDERVVLLEADRKRAERAAEELDDVTVIHGIATDQTLLDDEEIETVSTFVAATGDHESNLVAGLLARRLGAQRAIALVDNPALVAMVGDIGIDAIISPRSITIGMTLQHIRGRTVRSGAALLEDQVEIVEVEATGGGRLSAGPLSEVELPRGVLVVAIRRGQQLLVPRGSDTVEAGDRVLLITTTDVAPKLTDFLGS
ncbi:MAG: Trk system potassium transporter TrkA [Myxococcota bacterium]